MSDIRSVLVLGSTGMLGSAVLRVFSQKAGISVFGSARSSSMVQKLPAVLQEKVITGVDAEHPDHLTSLIDRTRPDVIVNCVGLVKQLALANDPLSALPINALLPHRLAKLAHMVGARLVHISTDCVFKGTKGGYVEGDEPDAQDLYGRSKLLGEVDYDNALTLRTSIIGTELDSAHGLVGWFLAQSGLTRGFRRAVFSGLPTVELANVIWQHVLPRPDLRGLYHVSASPISKYELLKLVARTYGRSTQVVPDDALVIDRSLNSDRFRAATGYEPPPWVELVQRMRDFDPAIQ